MNALGKLPRTRRILVESHYHQRENTGSRLFTEVKPCWMGLISGWVTTRIKYTVLYLGSQAGIVKHQSRLPPLPQMMSVDWVSVDLNLTLRVFSGHSGFLPRLAVYSIWLSKAVSKITHWVNYVIFVKQRNYYYYYYYNPKNYNFLNCDWFKKNSYFPLIHLPSCYRTVCYRTACYRTVQQTNHIQSCS